MNKVNFKVIKMTADFIIMLYISDSYSFNTIDLFIIANNTSPRSS